MNIDVRFQGLQNLFRAAGFGARLFGNVPFFGPVANQAGAAGGLIGLLSRFGRLGAVALSTATALAGLGSVAIRAGRTIQAQGLAGLSMGGTSAQGLQLRGLGGAAGLNMEQMGALGEQVGGFNRSERLLQHIQRIQSLGRWEEVLQYTRGRGLEALQATWFLTRRQTEAMRREAQARQGLFGLQATARAVQFNFELERLKNNFGDLATGIGSVLLPPLASAVEWLNRLFTFGAGSGSNPVNQAANNLNRAAAELSGAARTMGGGPRAQGAIPAALRGEVFNDALQRRAIQWGALIP